VSGGSPCKRSTSLLAEPRTRTPFQMLDFFLLFLAMLAVTHSSFFFLAAWVQDDFFPSFCKTSLRLFFLPPEGIADQVTSSPGITDPGCW